MIQISGASDDIITMSGDIKEEFCPPNDFLEGGKVLVAVSDGTLLRVNYDEDGIWRFSVIKHGSASYAKTEGHLAGKNEKGDTNDVVFLNGRIEWVALAIEHAS